MEMLRLRLRLMERSEMGRVRRMFIGRGRWGVLYEYYVTLFLCTSDSQCHAKPGIGFSAESELARSISIFFVSIRPLPV